MRRPIAWVWILLPLVTSCTRTVCPAGVQDSTPDRFLISMHTTFEVPAGRELLALLMTNDSATFGVHALDRDEDGVSDQDEGIMGLNPLESSSAGDGYSDLVRWRAPDVFAAAPPPCLDTSDQDHDGLRACEEALLGTSPANPDSDGDLMPDGLELRAGTQAAQADAELDADFDDERNGQELRAHMDPTRKVGSERVYRYVLWGTGATAEGDEGFDLSVHGVRVATPGQGSWRNRVTGWLAQRDQAGAVHWFAACLWVAVPEDGVTNATLDLKENTWRPLQQLDPASCQEP